MKFCPKCGGLMVPAKKNGKTVLRCTKCGYEMRSGKEKDKYKISEKVKEEKKVKTTSLVSTPSRFGISTEEQQQRLEDYYDIALELIQEEMEGTEGEE